MRTKPGYLETYCQTMHRVYWAEFIETQMRPTQGRRFRASIVGSPFVDEAPVPQHRAEAVLLGG